WRIAARGIIGDGRHAAQIDQRHDTKPTPDDRHDGPTPTVCDAAERSRLKTLKSGVRVGALFGHGVGPWRSPVALRCPGPLHFYSGRAVDDDAPLLMVIAPRLAVSDARARLANLVRVHGLVAGDRVPAVVASDLDASSPWVALACDAIAD